MEKLYNNIILQDDFASEPSDAQNVPYLKNPPEVINISVGRQLFVDDFLIEETDLSFGYHKAEKFEGNPVLTAETEWEKFPAPVACPRSGGVWYDEEEKIFKMWYEAGLLHQMCYATSKDGIHWERPNLDLEEGTNKILVYEGFAHDKFLGENPDVRFLRPDSPAVIMDYNAPKEERYKLFLRNPDGRPYPGIVAVSADGIHFEKFKFTRNVGDRSTVFYNPFRKKWVYSIRAGWKARSRNYVECDDYLAGAEWAPEDEHRWMAADELDEPMPYIREMPQLYNVDCVGYESIMLGMFEIHYGPANEILYESGVPKVTELIPMYSRDGYHFSRPCRDSIITSTMHKGDWDRGYVQSVGGVGIINGDEFWIYYSAFAGDENHKGKEWTVNGMYHHGAAGIAKMRRDGFVSMDGSGTLLTRKMEMQGKSALYVNVDGEISAEILNAEGAPLAKSNVYSGNSTKAELVFEDFDVRSLNDTVFRIKFTVNGSLYAFGFADENGDFGGAHAAGIVK